jgi:hypothetical protein
MNKTFKALIISSLCLFVLGSAQLNHENEDPNGKAGATGSPSESACNASGCHVGTALNSGPGSVTISSSNLTDWMYVPGQSYSISVTVAETGRSLFGLGFEALKSNGDNAGTLVAGTGTTIKTKVVGGFSRKNIVQQTDAGATSNSHTFTFTWNAPATDVGNITFYVAGNAANNDNDEAGDHIYTSSQVVGTFVGVNEYYNPDFALNIYPNPASQSLNVQYKLQNASTVGLIIYDSQGAIITQLQNQLETSGEYQKSFDITGLAAGNYMLELNVNNERKMIKNFICK